MKEYLTERINVLNGKWSAALRKQTASGLNSPTFKIAALEAAQLRAQIIEAELCLNFLITSNRAQK